VFDGGEQVNVITVGSSGLYGVFWHDARGYDAASLTK
jgi:hypothetical protein